MYSASSPVPIYLTLVLTLTATLTRILILTVALIPNLALAPTLVLTLTVYPTLTNTNTFLVPDSGSDPERCRELQGGTYVFDPKKISSAHHYWCPLPTSRPCSAKATIHLVQVGLTKGQDCVKVALRV